MITNFLKILANILKMRYTDFAWLKFKIQAIMYVYYYIKESR